MKKTVCAIKIFLYIKGFYKQMKKMEKTQRMKNYACWGKRWPVMWGIFHDEIPQMQCRNDIGDL